MSQDNNQANDNTDNSVNVADKEMLVTEGDHAFLRHIYSKDYQGAADENTASGGQNRGMNPYELFLAAIGSSVSMSMRQYANRENIALDDVEVRLSHDRNHALDCRDTTETTGKLERLSLRIKLSGALDDKQRKQLMSIAENSPLYKTLRYPPLMTTRLHREA